MDDQMERTKQLNWKLLSSISLVMAGIWLGYVLLSPELGGWGQWLRNISALLFANGTQVATEFLPRTLHNRTIADLLTNSSMENVTLHLDENGTSQANTTLGEEEEEDATNNSTMLDDNATLATTLGAALNGTSKQHKLGFLLRTCAEDHRSSTSKQLVGFLQRLWHPVDCASLTPVQVPLVNSGLGARLNMLGPALVCLAASGGLPLLLHHNVYVNHRVCPSGDLDCYFLPISNCTAHQKHPVKMEEHLRRHNVSHCSQTLRAAAGLPPSVPDGWMAKEVLQYYMRPNQHLRMFVESVANQQGLREPFLSIHLRTGQRFTWQNEKKKFHSRTVTEQLRQWVDHARKAGHRSIFFASDLPSMAGTLVRLAEGSGVAVAVVPPGLFPTMRSPPNQRAEQYLQTYYRTHATDLDEGLALLGTFFLLSSATEAVVTQSSNVGEVVRSLMWCGDKEPNLTVTFPKPYGLPVNKKRRGGKGVP